MENNFLPILILAIVMFALAAIAIMKFRAVTAPWLKDIFGGLQTAVAEVKAEEAMKQSEPEQKTHEPITWERVKYHCAMPALFAIAFPIQFVLLRMAAKRIDGSTDIAVTVLGVGVVAGLIVLVLYALAQIEKNPRRKFWMDLIVTLFMELGMVFDFHLLLEGYYFENTRGAKSLAYSLLFIPLWFAYFKRTQRNWQALQDEKRERN